jgi:hypothetical protein
LYKMYVWSLVVHGSRSTCFWTLLVFHKYQRRQPKQSGTRQWLMTEPSFSSSRKRDSFFRDDCINNETNDLQGTHVDVQRKRQTNNLLQTAPLRSARGTPQRALGKKIYGQGSLPSDYCGRVPKSLRKEKKPQN